MKKYIVMLIICISAISLRSAEFGITGGAGSAWFGMNDLKLYNKVVMSSLPVQAKLTDDFPAFFYGKLGVFVEFEKKYRVGIEAGTASTGSKIDYRDYSGSYTNTCKASAFHIGAFGSYNFIDPELPFKADLCLSVGLMKDKIDFDDKLTVGTSSQIQKVNLSADCFFFEFGLKPAWKINGRLEIGISLSYFINADVKYTYQSAATQYSSDWSGMRTGVYAAVKL